MVVTLGMDQRKYLDAAALLQKLDNMICLDTKSPDDQVMKTALANIGKELGTARDAIHYALGKDWDTHVGIRSVLVTNFFVSL